MNIKKTILWLTALLSTTAVAATVFAWNPDQSNFTPETREAIPFNTNQPGLPYSSFNNFTGNPNIMSNSDRTDEREGDEREFLLGAHCQGGECPLEPGLNSYQNTPHIVEDDGSKSAIVFEEGDRVQFEIYFHNNADDPKDGDSIVPDDAENVNIGVRLNSVLSEDEEVLNPVGYINADGVEYREDKNDSSTVIKVNGVNINEITDDMYMLRFDKDFKLKAVPGSAWLRVKLDGKEENKNPTYFDQYLSNGTTPITFTNLLTPDGEDTSTTITATPNFLDQDMWVNFDKLPGCFRYSGFLYFEAEIIGKKEVEPTKNNCEHLTLNDPNPLTACQAAPNSTILQAKVKLKNDDVVPKEQYITFTLLEDDKAKIDIEQPDGTFNTNTTPINNSAPYKYVAELRDTDPDNGIYTVKAIYHGIGGAMGDVLENNPVSITAYYSDADGNEILEYSVDVDGNIDFDNAEQGSNKYCKGYAFTCDDLCTDMETVTPDPIYEGSWSIMAGKNSKNYYDDEWTDTFLYSVEQGHGEFYSSLLELKTEHPESYMNPANPDELIVQVPLFMSTQTLNIIDQVFGSGSNGPIQPVQSYNSSANLYSSVLMALVPAGNGIPLSAGIPLNAGTPPPPSDGTAAETGPTLQQPSFSPQLPVQTDEIVFFYAEKEGKDVVEIRCDETDAKECIELFDIVKYPVCQQISATIESFDIDGNLITQNPECIFPDHEYINITLDQIQMNNGQMIDPANHDITVEWEIKPGTGGGVFVDYAGSPTSPNSITTISEKIRFKGHGTLIATVTEIDGFPAGIDCYFEYVIDECPDVCEAFILKFDDPASPDSMLINQTENISYEILDGFGEPLESEIRWSYNTGGILRFQGLPSQDPTDPTKIISPFPEFDWARMEEPTTPGEIYAEVVGHEDVCNGTLLVKDDVCANLEVLFQDGTDTMLVGEKKYFDIKATSASGAEFLGEIKWTNLAGGLLRFTPGTAIQSFTAPTTITAYPDSIFGGLEEPTSPRWVTAEIIGHEEACNAQLNVAKAPAEPDMCRDIQVKFADGTDTMYVGESKKIKITNLIDTNDGQYSGQFKWHTDTQGVFLFQDLEGNPTSLPDGSKVVEHPLTNGPSFQNPKQAGIIEVQVYGDEVSNVEKNLCTATLKVIDPPPPIVCEALTIKVLDEETKTSYTNPPSLTTTESYGIIPSATYSDGANEATIDYSTDKGCFSQGAMGVSTILGTPTWGPTYDENGDLVCTPTLEDVPSQYKVYFYPDPELEPGTYEDAIEIQVSGTETDTEIENCSHKIDLIVPEKPDAIVCEDLTVEFLNNKDNQSYTNPQTITIEEEVIKEGEIYIISPSATYSDGSHGETANYSTDVGCFSPGEPHFISPMMIPFWLPTYDENGALVCTPTLEDIPLSDKVYFYPDKDLAPGEYENAVSITVNGTTVENCAREVDIVVTEKPIEKVACGSIELVPAQGDFIPTDGTQIHINPDTAVLNDFEGTFNFRITQGYFESFEEDGSDINLSIPSATSSSLGATTQGAYPNEGITTTVFVDAVGDLSGTCSDTIYYTRPITPPNRDCKDLRIVKPTEPWYIGTNNTTGYEEFIIEVDGYPAEYTYIWERIGTEGGFTKTSPTETVGYEGMSNSYYLGKPGDIVRVYADGYEGICDDSITAGTRYIPGGSKTQPKFNKYVYADGKSSSGKSTININSKTDVEFKLVFKAGTDTKSVKIRDHSLADEGKGVLEGSQGGELVFKDRSFDVTYKRGTKTDDVELCDTEESKSSSKAPCMASGEDMRDSYKMDDALEDFKDGDYIYITNLKKGDKIEVEYKMENDSVITTSVCRGLDPVEDGCGEEFENDAEFTDYKAYDWENKNKSGDDSTKVVVICPYILTRTGGDTFFRSEIDTGVDVAYCSPQKNIQGPVIIFLPTEQKNPGTGGTTKETETLQLPSHNICKYSNVEDFVGIEEYNNPLKTFSSAICEMQAQVAESWQKDNVVSKVNNNLSKISFWSTPIQDSYLQDVSGLTGGINKWEKDLYIEGTQSSSKRNAYKIEASKTEGIPAAQTYLVIGNDLHINSDIIYSTELDTSLNLNPKDVPSAAFIVIDGDIIIDEDVEELWGIYIAVDSDDEGNDGRILSGNKKSKEKEGVLSDKQLTIYGSLIGNVIDLFQNRIYVGNVASEEGSITIKYTENIILNTPPGLTDVLNLESFRVTK